MNERLINRALHKLNLAATDTSKSIYDRNKEVYDLLRYGMKVQPGAGENRVTVARSGHAVGYRNDCFHLYRLDMKKFEFSMPTVE